ncbi:MAG: MFS transporter, partial [Saccharothrix sp.]|nr:MFS transporter [Saccharothrix sp.]
KGAQWRWTSPLTLGLFACAAAVLVAWTWWESRTASPLVDLRTTTRRQVLLTNAASAVFGFSMFAMSLVSPQILQLPAATGYGLGQSLVVVGLVLAPSGLVMMSMAPVSARISAARGPRTTLITGALVVAVGYGLFTVLMTEIWHLLLVSAVVGAGIGLAYGAMPALVMAAVPISETAAANSLNTLMRSIGTSVCSAVAGAVLAQLTTPFGGVLLPTQNAFRVIMVIGAAAALAAAGIAFLLPGRRAAVAPRGKTGATAN